jgi:hypothetical protein
MTTYPSLLEQFLNEECTPHVRKLICEAALNREPTHTTKEFEFNRFNLKLDFAGGRAILDDELDVRASGSAETSIDELLTLLGCDVMPGRPQES